MSSDQMPDPGKTKLIKFPGGGGGGGGERLSFDLTGTLWEWLWGGILNQHFRLSC